MLLSRAGSEIRGNLTSWSGSAKESYFRHSSAGYLERQSCSIPRMLQGPFRAHGFGRGSAVAACPVLLCAAPLPPSARPPPALAFLSKKPFLKSCERDPALPGKPAAPFPSFSYVLSYYLSSWRLPSLAPPSLAPPRMQGLLRCPCERPPGATSGGLVVEQTLLHLPAFCLSPFREAEAGAHVALQPAITSAGAGGRFPALPQRAGVAGSFCTNLHWKWLLSCQRRCRGRPVIQGPRGGWW